MIYAQKSRGQLIIFTGFAVFLCGVPHSHRSPKCCGAKVWRLRLTCALGLVSRLLRGIAALLPALRFIRAALTKSTTAKLWRLYYYYCLFQKVTVRSLCAAAAFRCLSNVAYHR